MVINEAGWVAFGFIIFCIIAWRYGAKPFVDVLESRANEVKEKLSKNLEDAEQNILNAKKDSLNIVNEVASDIAVIISNKISGIKISKNLILKSVNDKIKKSNLLENLKIGIK